jgi:diacylglycerol kinase (ATP)
VGIRAVLAVHRRSGRGTAARIADLVVPKLREVVDHLDVVAANTVDEARALMFQARDRGLDVLVVVGGDGSAHQGVQCCAGTSVALGVVPTGTGNDLVRGLGGPMEPMAAAESLLSALRSGRRRQLDLGRVNGGRWFATVLCAGFDSSVNERANRMRWPPGARRYDLATVVELAALRPRPLVVETGTEQIEMEATLVSVGNTRFYGSGIPICPQADPTDGLFDLTIVGKLTRLDLLRILPKARRAEHAEHPSVTTIRASRVRLGEDNGWIAYADGERIRALPVTVNCFPGALTVLGRV